MTKSELIEQISESYPDMTKKQVEFIVNKVFASIKDAIKIGEKVEIRGFGSFNVREKEPKIGRNPRDGSKVKIPAKKTPFFRPSKDIKEVLIKSSL